MKDPLQLRVVSTGSLCQTPPPSHPSTHPPSLWLSHLDPTWLYIDKHSSVVYHSNLANSSYICSFLAMFGNFGSFLPNKKRCDVVETQLNWPRGIQNNHFLGEIPKSLHETVRGLLVGDGVFGIWEAESKMEMERLDRERARTWEARSLAAADFLGQASCFPRRPSFWERPPTCPKHLQSWEA